MKKKSCAFGGVLLAALFLSFPGTASAQTVAVDYDRGVDFSKFKSYSWGESQPTQNPLVDKRIVTAIDGELASKGWTRDTTAPGAIVVYQAALKEDRQLVGWSSGPRWSGMGTVRTEKILTGQMVVDVYDAATKQLIWRGIVSDAVSDKPETNEKRLQAAVTKLFKRFPPSIEVRTGTR